MNFNVEQLGATRKKVSVEIPAETVTAEFDKAFGLLKKNAKIKGFRAGKVPKNILKRYFGPRVEMEVAQKLMDENLPKALEGLADSMVAPPDLEDSKLVEGEPFRFSVSCEVKPEFEVSGWQGIGLTKEKINVTDEMVEKKLEELRQGSATTKSVEEERSLVNGDLAVISYQSFEGETPIEGGSNPNYQLELGLGHFNPDFEKALEGLNKGGAKEVTTTFPKEYFNPKLAGREVRFQVEIKDIKQKVVPELNDEFAKDMGKEFENLAQLRDKIREELTKAEERRVDRQVRQQLMDKLVGLVEFEVPASLVSRELEELVANTKFNLKRSGLSPEAFGFSDDRMREEYRGNADKRVRTALILEKIASEQALEVTEKDEDERFAAFSLETGQTPEVIREIYIKNNMMSVLKSELLTEKALKSVLASATIEMIEPSPVQEEPETDQGETTAE